MKGVIKYLLLIAFALICKFSIDYGTYSEAEYKNDAKAQFELGKRYYTGHTSAGRYGGHKQDYKKAVEWWLKAAEQGNADAQYGLGCCYEEGHGVDKDLNEALKWYRKAAKQRNKGAKDRLKALGAD